MLSQSSFQSRSEYGFSPSSPTEASQINQAQYGEWSAQSQQQQQKEQQQQRSSFSSSLQRSNGSDGEAGDGLLPSPTEAGAPDKAGPARKSSANNPVRKRTSRACDSCNQLRTKCDGTHPCTHCTETGLSCEYVRVPKKRGKVSKKDLARQAALREKAAAGALHAASTKSTGSPSSGAGEPPGSVFHSGLSNLAQQPTSQPVQLTASLSDQRAYTNPSPTSNSHGSGLSQVGGSSVNATNGQALTSANMETQYQGLDLNAAFGAIPSTVMAEGSPMGDFRTPGMDFSNLYMGMGGLPGQALPLDGMEFPMQSPSAATSLSGNCQHVPSHVKHPVLLPLFPFLKNIMSPALAFELLEHFFTSASPEFPHPASPYHITTVFRKKSFLGPGNPRRCSPALLTSMLWSAAWTSDARALTSPPSARARLCQKLLNLCIFLLNPLVHGDRIGKGAPDAERNGVSKAHPMGVQEMLTDDDVPVKIASGTVNDVVTYMHIAIVVSASEDKGASLRWWSSAWNLAKELRLGRELGGNTRTGRPDSFFLRDEPIDASNEMNIDQREHMPEEEEREERRRVWWTLYLVDRHLSLCYNRQLTLHDSECVGLMRPMDEMAWQAGVFEPNPQPQFSWQNPRMANRFEFTGPSAFGYFLPISTILGEIIDLHHRRMHPFLGRPNDQNGDLTGYDAEVRSVCHQQLETFEKSMHVYRDWHIPPKTSGAGTTQGGRRAQLTETQYQIATACAYGQHLVHVMYILLYDRWDPANLLDDEDMWTSSPAFSEAVNHAVQGASAVADILKYDPQVGFMPYLYGIYLLQGSFLLLVMADRLATEANESTITACETIVRAHEACVVTLNTEYQRAFRRVMQSALAQVRGRMPQDGGEQQWRRRQTISLYKWVGDGGGLAV